MKCEVNKNKVVLLPRYFKTIGLGIIAILIAATVVIKYLNSEILNSHRVVFRVISSDIFILGLFFIAWSKDKVENEVTYTAKLKAMALSSGYVVYIVILSPFVNLLFKDPFQDNYNGQEVVLNFLLIYILTYYVPKLFKKKNLTKN